MVPGPRWTHIALPVNDVDVSAEWYGRFTPLEVVDNRRDTDGNAVWLADRSSRESPFVLVLVATDADAGHVRATLAPFAHLGFELPSVEAVTQIAERGVLEGCLAWEPQRLPAPVGYICALRDPDGNIVEFSFDQGVYAKVREHWSTPAGAASGEAAGDGEGSPA
jgi:lactoylglutathione lyase